MSLIFLPIFARGWILLQEYDSIFSHNGTLNFNLKKVLMRIFGPKREEDGSWRKLHIDELHSLYSSPNIVRVIISRKMRWVRHVARMGVGERCLQGFG
jgi:hypothetical protein